MSGTVLEFHGRALAAVLFCGAGSCASFVTAARIHALEPFVGATEIHVSVSGRRRPATRGLFVHRPHVLDRGEIASVRGVPTTRPARTLIDLAGHCDARSVELGLDDALRRGLVSPRSLLDQLARRPSKGRSLLRRFTLERLDVPTSESALEARFLRRMKSSGLSLPVPQYEVRDAQGRFVARVDFAYVEQRIAIEIDGLAFHHGRERFVSDRRRQNALQNEGYRVLRFTASDIDASWPLTRSTLERALRPGVGSDSRHMTTKSVPNYPL
jgi:hypothetical protein